MSKRFNCIAIETATTNCSVAACAGDRVASVQLADPRASSRQLYQALQEVMSKVDLQPTLLDCVAFGCGPGSFTGVRIAAAAAQGVAFAQSLPVCRVSTLAAMAVTAAEDSSGDATPVAVCLDARQGEVYMGLYGWEADGLPVALQPDALVQPAAMLLPTDHGRMLAVGNGWSVWPEMQERNQVALTDCMPGIWPDALAVLSIARRQFERGLVVAPADAIPNYVRDRVTQ
jgi:tRNA threonylcarbamoyladenosine biosynthesis protein TsaB